MNRKTILKFIVATILFYLALAFNVFHIGEKIAPQEANSSKNYLQENTPVENLDIEEEYFNITNSNDTN